MKNGREPTLSHTHITQSHTCVLHARTQFGVDWKIKCRSVPNLFTYLINMQWLLFKMWLNVAHTQIHNLVHVISRGRRQRRRRRWRQMANCSTMTHTHTRAQYFTWWNCILCTQMLFVVYLKGFRNRVCRKHSTPTRLEDVCALRLRNNANVVAQHWTILSYEWNSI